jgi:hypothetical protein
MKKIYLLTLLLLAVGVGGARAQDVRYNFAQGEDFSKCKTYNWVSIKNADQVDELTAMFVSDSSLPLLSIVRSNHMSLSNTSAHALTNLHNVRSARFTVGCASPWKYGQKLQPKVPASSAASVNPAAKSRRSHYS